jgi:predicted nucleic acid-binding protein
MNGRHFVDTNVLVYAHDRAAGRKNEIARDLVKRLWLDRSGVLSTQVLQEFYVNVRRKAEKPVSAAEARRLIEDYLCWHVIEDDGPALLKAIEFEGHYRITFWDALIVQAANASGASHLYSEDLNHGQIYGAVTVENPFRGED